jgi:hypothetical protein
MEITETIMVSLLAVGVLFLFMLLLAVVRAGGCLQRIQRALEARETTHPVTAAEPTPKPATDVGFKKFLAEDPARRKLPKREQFEAYRKWRRAKGLNWSQP